MKRIIFYALVLITTISCTEKSPVIDYWPNGTRKTEVIITKGSIQEPVEYTLMAYYSNGKLFKEGSVINGKESGIWKYYYADGNLKSTIKYENGIYNGPYEIFYRNGKLKQKGDYKQNQLKTIVHYTIEGIERDSTPNIILPQTDVEPWTKEQLELITIECMGTESMKYENVEGFCGCMIKNISLYYSYEVFSQLTQVEIGQFYDMYIKDGFCDEMTTKKSPK